MIAIVQQTEISIRGGELPLLWILILGLLAILVMGLIVWLFRRVRKNVQDDNEWHIEEYSLIKPELPTSSPAVSMEPQPPSQLSVETPEITEPLPLSDQRDQAPSPGSPNDDVPSVAASPSLVVEPPPLIQTPPPLADSATSPPPTPVSTASVSMEEYPLSEMAGSTASESILSRDVINEVRSEVASMPQPDRSFFQSPDNRIEPERSRTTLLIVAGSIGVLAAIYFLVFPVQDAVNSVASDISHKLGQLFRSQPANQGRVEPLPQLDVVQDIASHDQSIVITGRVRNSSSDTLDNLFAEFALAPMGVDLTETRLVPVQPGTLQPNQEGKFILEIGINQFSKCQLTRMITADKKEISFRLLLTLPGHTTQQP